MKDSYYFPHDYHARHDPKLERLRMEIGPAGDGIYWDLVEMLYEEGGYLPLKDIPLIAKTLNTPEELVNKVVKDTKLFVVNCDKFYSESLLFRLSHIKAKVRKARTSANKRWNAKALPTHSEGNVIKVKESKVKESKESNKASGFSFEEIYLKYPNKVGKKNALRHFEVSVKTEQDWLDINKALLNYLESDRVKKGFIQNASTFFNDWRAWVNVTKKSIITFKED